MAITPIISGLTLLIPFITGVISHLLSGMSHQVYIYIYFRIHGAGIYANIGGILMVIVTIYMALVVNN